jgi:hypothetical protein
MPERLRIAVGSGARRRGTPGVFELPELVVTPETEPQLGMLLLVVRGHLGLDFSLGPLLHRVVTLTTHGLTTPTLGLIEDANQVCHAQGIP